MPSTLLGPFLNQTCVLEKGIIDPEEGDLYSDVRYSAPQTIICRREAYDKLLYGQERETVQIKNTYFIGPDYRPIAWSDRIDGVIVHEVYEWPWLDGTIVGYEVLV